MWICTHLHWQCPAPSNPPESLKGGGSRHGNEVNHIKPALAVRRLPLCPGDASEPSRHGADSSDASAPPTLTALDVGLIEPNSMAGFVSLNWAVDISVDVCVDILGQTPAKNVRN